MTVSDLMSRIRDANISGISTSKVYVHPRTLSEIQSDLQSTGVAAYVEPGSRIPEHVDLQGAAMRLYGALVYPRRDVAMGEAVFE